MGRKVGSVPLTWRYVGKKEGEEDVRMDVPLRTFAKAIGVKAYSIRKFPIVVNGWTITRQRWVMEYVLKQDSDND
jgi:hypothetical protein